jgi:hypothetical protein
MKHDKMADVCEALIDFPVHKRACAIAGIERRTFYRWMNSDPSDPDFIFEWNGKTAHFTQHVYDAMRKNALNGEAHSREMWTEGFEELVTKDGKICFHEDEDIINAGYGDADKETLMLIFGQPDIYLRDPVTRHRIPIKVKRAPPAALINKMLSSHMPKLYGDVQNVNVNSQGTSVLIVGNKPAPALPKPVHVTPKEMVAELPPAKLKDVAAPEITETPPPDFAPDMGKDAASPVFNGDPPVPPRHEPEPQPEVVAAEPSLDERAAAARARLLAQAATYKPKNPRPTGPVNTGLPPDLAPTKKRW